MIKLCSIGETIFNEKKSPSAYLGGVWQSLEMAREEDGRTYGGRNELRVFLRDKDPKKKMGGSQPLGF